jgi:hypothetical protein
VGIVISSSDNESSAVSSTRRLPSRVDAVVVVVSASFSAKPFNVSVVTASGSTRDGSVSVFF